MIVRAVFTMLAMLLAAFGLLAVTGWLALLCYAMAVLLFCAAVTPRFMRRP